MKDLRYPIGQFKHDGSVPADVIEVWIEQIEALPGQIRRAVESLTDDQLDTRYRPGGWTLRQVVHHVPDSHINCYVRFKWALTEEEPVIKTYDEKRWAELDDDRVVPIKMSLDLLDAVHVRWAELLRSLSPSQLQRRFLHPEWGPVELASAIGMYAWHGRHHLAHITQTIEKHGW